MRAWLVLALSCAAAAQAQSFSGRWASEVGDLDLRQQGARLTGTARFMGVTGTLSGAVQGASASGTYASPDGDGTFSGRLEGDGLSMTFDDAPAVPFRRAGGAPEAAPPSTATGAARPTEPPPRVGPADGAEHRAEAEGWAVRAPRGWRAQADGLRVVFTSATETGTVVAMFRPGATLADLQQAATAGFTDSGLALAPTAAPQAIEARSAKGLAVDMQATAPDGTPLRVRAAGVVGGGGAVAVIGLSAPDAFGGLRGRVDQVARSVSFFAPKASAGAHLLRCTLCSFSGGSVASFSNRFTFDGRGRVSRGSEMVAGGQFNDGLGNTTGSWGATSQGGGEAGSYAVQGGQVLIRIGDDTWTCRPHVGQPGGPITELKCGGTLYGAALCD